MTRIAIVLGTLLTGTLAIAAYIRLDCSLTETGLVALHDLGTDLYKHGHTGGLYPGGNNTRPDSHLAAGLAIAANEVFPRDALGNRDDANGVIGMFSIGMCNTSQEFDSGSWTFVDRMQADGALSPRVRFVNGAQGGQPASAWATRPDNMPPWSLLADRIAAEGLQPEQVQVIWIKQAQAGPGTNYGPFPVHAEALRDDLQTIMTRVVDQYPNVRMCFLSSRTRAYTDIETTLNPEPYAYESAFSVRWLIERQIDGEPALDYNLPDPEAPWLSWGPYLWSDGEAGRSDGFQWFCADLNPDFTHPSMSGEEKVSDQLVAFFKTDAATRPWFLKSTSAGTPPTVQLLPSASIGPAPLQVRIVADASDDGNITQYAWNYEDGSFAFGSARQVVHKTFHVPGVYEVTATVTDDDGDWTAATTTITVTEADTISLTPEADAYVRSGNMAGQNFGTRRDLIVRQAGGNQNARAYLRYDLSNLPRSCTAATLNLWSQQIVQGSGSTVHVTGIDDNSWSETAITWNNQPGPGPRADTRLVNDTGLLYRFDVTDLVNRRLARDQHLTSATPKVSFVVSIQIPDTTLIGFSSREGTSAPVLEIVP